MEIVAFEKPEIFVTEADLETLTQLIPTHPKPLSGAALLGDELERATIAANDSTQVFARLNSQIVYRDLDSGQERNVTLGLPIDANIDAGIISVLSPVGAALIGLPEGAQFQWSMPGGRVRKVQIESIQPAR